MIQPQCILEGTAPLTKNKNAWCSILKLSTLFEKWYMHLSILSKEPLKHTKNITQHIIMEKYLSYFVGYSARSSQIPMMLYHNSIVHTEVTLLSRNTLTTNLMHTAIQANPEVAFWKLPSIAFFMFCQIKNKSDKKVLWTVHLYIMIEP